ncbi:hypothetical protein F511_12646 [Dorcoceras hygrometricum]|uniref:Uncharacterized protein n=1 Tax=Dorcoceras hygrometricum TaxID=472368 RepID=A0A2Z7CCJ1_9LAMI|nr:hypothetical protein F511_12646 [Dorcoceras hygrometricum]
MSLFELQDVCIAIRSLATLDLPMVVDLIGIYGLKGPYCMLTTTNWFLQVLSVIPRGSWGDVARRSYHDPLGKFGIMIQEPQWDEGIDQLNFHSAQLGYLKLLQMGTQTQQNKAGNKYEVKPQYEELSKQPISRWKSSVRDHRGPSAHHSSVETLESGSRHSDDSVGLFGLDSTVGQSQRGTQSEQEAAAPFSSNLTSPPPLVAAAVRRTCSGQLFEENPLAIKSFSLLVQADRREIVSGQSKRSEIDIASATAPARMAVHHHHRREHESARRLRAGRAWRATAGHVQRMDARSDAFAFGDGRTLLRPLATRWPVVCALSARLKRGGRPLLRAACWTRNWLHGDARGRAPACGLASHVISWWRPPPDAASPAKLRRCRDG